MVATPCATPSHSPLRRHTQQHPVSGQSQLVHAVPDRMAGAGRATRRPHEVLCRSGGQAATATRGGAACAAVDSSCQGRGLEGGGREGAWRHVQVWPAPGSSNISRWHTTRSVQVSSSRMCTDVQHSWLHAIASIQVGYLGMHMGPKICCDWASIKH